MKYLALKELPDGTPSGQMIDIHEDMGAVLVLVDAARTLTNEEIEEQEKASSPGRRRQYRRRDMEAEGSGQG